MSNRICVFGEVLFDHFPGGERVLGGAPFNVAWHLQGLGLAPLLISRVGNDPEGESIRSAVSGWGMDLTSLQTDDNLPSGAVNVSFTGGEPEYDIVHPAAFDAIECPDSPAEFFLLYHGSLALRNNISRHSLERLKRARPSLVFVDVNLRPPWCDRAQVLEWIGGADWVKLNHHELDWLTGEADENDQGTGPERAVVSGQARDFMAKHALQAVVLTHGAEGAELLKAEGGQYRVRPGGSMKVVDTVGAGDAFTAVVIAGLARAWAPDLIMQRAQQFASAVVGLRGATTDDIGFYREFLSNWSSS